MSFSDRFFSRRLGGLYRLFQASIFLYIAVSIIYQQRYLKTENIINGAVRVTLKAPVDGVATPSYCKSSSQPCIYWNENDILYDPGVDGALVTTRAQITQYGPLNNETLPTTVSRCDVNLPTIPGCDTTNTPTTSLLPTSLVADIERFTLMLEHSIRGQATGVQIRSGNMESGLLRDSITGEVIRSFNDKNRFVPAASASISLNTTNGIGGGSEKMVHLAGDVMTMGEFLRAAGVNLDELSTAPTATNGETVRSSGVVVIVVIQYAAKGWNPNRISYEYLPKAIPDQEYKVIETIRDFRNGRRVEINRHGIRIVFSQAGQLGQFSLMTLLTNLVAAVALFKVANIIVELMMLRLHPQKKVYVRAKFQCTKDASHDQEGPFKADEHTARSQDHSVIDDEMDQGSNSSTMKMTNYNASSHFRGNDRRGQSLEDSEKRDKDLAGVIEDVGGSTKPVEALALSRGHSAIESSGMRSRFGTSRYLSSGTANDTIGEKFESAALIEPLAGGGSLSGVDWNRNGSRSGLISDATVDFRTTGSYSGDIEIETRFGPLRPNEFKGFNPGGLSLSSTPPLSPHGSQKRLMHIGHEMSTPRHQASTDSKALATFQEVSTSNSHSPAMQSVSPFPVYFATPNNRQNDSAFATSGKNRCRPRRHGATNQGASSSVQHGITMLSSRNSSCSLSSMSSSSSSLSLSASCENIASPVMDDLTKDTVMNVSLAGPGMSSSSTVSFGAPESPLAEYSSGGESISGPKQKPMGPPASSSSMCKRGYKKRRKDYHPTSSVSLSSLLQPASCEGPALPMFGLGTLSNVSSFSLSLGTLSGSSTGIVDVKGKQPDYSSLSHAPRSSESTEICNSQMTPLELPLPGYLEHGPLSSLGCVSSQWNPPSSSSVAHGKQPVRSSFYQALQSSVSSPDLFLHGCCSTAVNSSTTVNDTTTINTPAIGFSNQLVKDLETQPAQDLKPVTVLEGYPDSYTMAVADLPPRTSNWQFLTTPLHPLVATAATNSTSGSSSGSFASTPAAANTVNAFSTSETGGYFERLRSSDTVASGGASTETGKPRRFSESELRYGSVSHFAATPLSETGEVMFPSLSSCMSSAMDARHDGPRTSPVPPTLPSRSNTNDDNSLTHERIQRIREALAARQDSPHGGTGLADTDCFRGHPRDWPTVTTTPKMRNASDCETTMGSSNNNSGGYPHPTSAFFSSPITSSFTTTLAGTGVRVLGRTITMVTADNKKLVLRRSAPLVLHEGVGEEKAARM
ncbi:cytochrome c oxidase subunit 1 [Dissophora globulifera]|uniref:Cytochrome c oxidase subunit 1 n=1 Tax=Dissophora globulifera TaxID=979702 RepID=A0A9P6RPR2_9FUNG|nr:cytochrome c oxidase subunit 1 [Dissophora globulifera]